MRININKCERCGFEARDDTEKKTYNTGFSTVNISFDTYDRQDTRYKITKPYMFICHKCLEKIGVERIEKKEELTNENEVDIKSKLYDIVATIVEEVNRYNSQ